MLGLVDTATVYVPGGDRGRFITVAKTGLRCRRTHVDRRGGATGAQRAELGALRNFLWEADYVMPAKAQLEMDGLRWNIISNTIGAPKGPDGTVHHRHCDIVRAIDG